MPFRFRPRPGSRDAWGAADPAFADAIETLASVRTRDLSLPPAIHADYLADTWPSRAKINIGWMMWAAAVNTACAAFDPLIFSDRTLVAALAMRAAVTLAFVAGAIAMRLMPRSGAEGAVTIACCAVMIAVAGIADAGAGPEFQPRYLVQSMFLGGTAILCARIAWRDTLILTGVVIAMATAFMALQPQGGGPTAETVQTILFFDAGLLGLALAKRAMERLHYRVYVLTQSDRLKMREIEAINGRLHDMARTDPLTGLPNRRHFDETFSRLRETAGSGVSAALVMIDIDCFKQLNDRFGHVAGDECLAAVAGLIRACLRDGEDFVARFGGEEFVALLPGVSRDEARDVAERIRAAVEARAIVNPGGVGGLVTISAGVAVSASGAPDALVRAADAALYEAKSSGRNAVRLAAGLGARRVA